MDMVGGHPRTTPPLVANGGEQSSEGAHGTALSCVCCLTTRTASAGMPWPCHAMPHLPLLYFPVLSLASPHISLSAGVLTRSSRSKYGASKDRFIIYQAHGTFFFLVSAWTFLVFLKSACFVSFSDMPVSITNTLGK